MEPTPGQDPIFDKLREEIRQLRQEIESAQPNTECIARRAAYVSALAWARVDSSQAHAA